MNLTSGVADASWQLYNVKTQLRTLEGIRGQVQYKLGNKLKVGDHVLINSHFAALPSNELIVKMPAEDNTFEFCHLSDEQIAAKGALATSSSSASNVGALRAAWASAIRAEQQWIPVPQFPSCKEDPLLSLLLGGCSISANSNGRHPPPFMLGSKILTAAMAYMVTNGMGLQGEKKLNTYGVHEAADQRESNYLEAICALATVCASGCAGPCGCSAVQFLSAMVAELQPHALSAPLQLSATSVALSQVWKYANDARVPYMARCGDEYPTGLVGAVTGSIQRTRSAVEADQLWTEMMREFDALSAPSAEGKESQYLAQIPCCYGKGLGKDGKDQVGAPTIDEVRDKAGKHDAKLAVLVMSKQANRFHKPVSTHNTNVVHFTIVDGKLHLRVLDRRTVALPEPKERLLCVMECDSEDALLPIARSFLPGYVPPASEQSPGISGQKSGVAGRRRVVVPRVNKPK